MSTTFDVLPGNKNIPTFDCLLKHANSKINDFLQSVDINERIKLCVQLRSNDEKIVKDNILDSPFIWDDDFYSWFFIEGIPGGTDAYFWKIDELDLEIWNGEITTNKKIIPYKKEIKTFIGIGYRWNFRRSAGQPGIVALSYGLIAASLAKLTDGFVYSDDNACDYSLFPTFADNFFLWYFKPELTEDNDFKDWAKTCIASIRDEISNAKKLL